MKVYVVEVYGWDDVWSIDKIFSDKDTAENYVKEIWDSYRAVTVTEEDAEN